jgi:hypothetical protein
VHGAATCSRLGCDEPAVAVFAFDARQCLVWLDPLDAGGAGVLCATHADRMSPPHGWNLLDRREAEARLWIGRTAATDPTIPTRRRTRDAKHGGAVAPGPSLPFDAPAAAAAATRAPAKVAAPARAAEDERRPWSPQNRPGPEFDRVIDARTPLLARAFDAARRGEESA